MTLADQLRDMYSRPEWRLRPEVLLCANTVKPMHGVVPRLILGQEWLDKTRQDAYLSTDYHCIACGVSKWEAEEHKWLEGHEVYKIDYKRGRMTYIETVPLCHYCHNFIHKGRLKALCSKGLLERSKYELVIEHGTAILKRAGLKKRPYHGPHATWADWRLILEGKEYPPIYKDYKEWKEHFLEGKEM